MKKKKKQNARGARMRGLGDLSSDHVAEGGGEREKDEYSRTAG